MAAVVAATAAIYDTRIQSNYVVYNVVSHNVSVQAHTSTSTIIYKQVFFIIIFIKWYFKLGSFPIFLLLLSHIFSCVVFVTYKVKSADFFTD